MLVFGNETQGTIERHTHTHTHAGRQVLTLPSPPQAWIFYPPQCLHKQHPPHHQMTPALPLAALTARPALAAQGGSSHTCPWRQQYAPSTSPTQLLWHATKQGGNSLGQSRWTKHANPSIIIVNTISCSLQPLHQPGRSITSHSLAALQKVDCGAAPAHLEPPLLQGVKVLILAPAKRL